MPVLSPATVANLAIRSYEKKGSLPKPRRRSSDAAYHQEHFERLIFNRRAVDGATRDCPVVLALSRPSQVMFTLWFDRASEVLLARFTGIFTTEDFTSYDAAMIHFLGTQGANSTDRWRTLCDLSAIEAIVVPESRLAEQGSHPPIVSQMRVVVAPPFAGDDFGNGYREQQRAVHGTEPLIVATLKEAYVLLGLDSPKFEAVEQS